MAVKSIRVVMVIGVLAACWACVVACGGKSTGERLAEKAMEKAMERGGVKDADVDMKSGKVRFKTEEGDGEISYQEEGWPKDLPHSVPEFSLGKVKGVIRTERAEKQSWNIVLESLEDGAVAKYAKQLEGKGWAIMSQMTTQEGGMVQATKDDLLLIGMFNTEDGEGSLSIGHQ
ncbi:hypothetical protein JXA88_10715 [Candidatus Fermentibacteria bacterium]|nr:hypothetical protein [Candidatus Fermentibacteria bacterium]